MTNNWEFARPMISRAMIVVLSLVLLCSCGRPDTTRQVSRADFQARGLTWPLTVDSGRLGREGNSSFFVYGDTRYGLNGFATKDRGFAPIEPIWATDDQMMDELKHAGAGGTTLRISIGDMISEASKLCS